MTPGERLAASLRRLRWSGMDLASMLHHNERTIRRWLANEYPVPPETQAWLDKLVALHEANPPP